MTFLVDTLISKIEAREAVVSLVGVGYVGVPLALAFVESGFPVAGVDMDESRVAKLNAGKSYVSDISSSRLGAAVAGHPSRRSKAGGDGRGGRLAATTSFDGVLGADVVIICVPTPLGKNKTPNMSSVIAATDEVARRLRKGMLVVLESTTYPGTTEEVVLPRLEQASAWRPRMKVGVDFFLGYSPERIDPGRTDYTVSNTPKVVGGVTPACLRATTHLYGSAVKRVVPVSSTKSAEMVKLLENTFRAVNISLVNEMAIMCNRLGVDIWEVIEGAKTKPFGFMPFYPGPGVGGHCIPVDPEYLAWKLETLDYSARFIQLAAEVSSGMPRYVVERVADALSEDRKPVQDSRILVLGVAYKADVADTRESPAVDLVGLLMEMGADVFYNDPYVPRLDVDGRALQSVVLDAQALESADCVVVTSAHSSYDWTWIVENSKLLVDTRNATRDVPAGKGRVVKL